MKILLERLREPQRADEYEHKKPEILPFDVDGESGSAGELWKAKISRQVKIVMQNVFCRFRMENGARAALGEISFFVIIWNVEVA